MLLRVYARMCASMAVSQRDHLPLVAFHRHTRLKASPSLLPSGSLVNKFGPRRSFALNNIPLIIGMLLMSLATSLDMFIVGMY